MYKTLKVNLNWYLQWFNPFWESIQKCFCHFWRHKWTRMFKDNSAGLKVIQMYIVLVFNGVLLNFSNIISTYMYKCKNFIFKAKDLEKILLEIFPSLITDFIKNLPGVSASVPFIALWAKEGNPARVASLWRFKIRASKILVWLSMG